MIGTRYLHSMDLHFNCENQVLFNSILYIHAEEKPVHFYIFCYYLHVLLNIMLIE